MTTYKVTLLVTLGSGEEDLRTFEVEARNPDEAAEFAKQQAMQDDEVVEVKTQRVQ